MAELIAQLLSRLEGAPQNGQYQYIELCGKHWCIQFAIKDVIAAKYKGWTRFSLYGKKPISELLEYPRLIINDKGEVEGRKR